MAHTQDGRRGGTAHSSPMKLGARGFARAGRIVSLGVILAVGGVRGSTVVDGRGPARGVKSGRQPYKLSRCGEAPALDALHLEMLRGYIEASSGIELRGHAGMRHSAPPTPPAAAAAIVAQQAADPTSALLTGAVTSAVTGVSVPAAVLEAAAAAASSTVTASLTTPEYFKQSEPREYTLPNMEQCMYTCRLLCETGNEVPSINGFPALPLERPRICKSQCMTHCGFGRPFTPGAL